MSGCAKKQNGGDRGKNQQMEDRTIEITQLNNREKTDWKRKEKKNGASETYGTMINYSIVSIKS